MVILVRYKQQGDWYSAKFDTKEAARQFVESYTGISENHGEVKV